MEFNIAFRIFDDLERSRFNSLFEIIPPRLDHQWNITDVADADVIIIDANEPGSEHFMQSCRQSASALPMSYSEQNYLNSEWYIPKPVRSANLVVALNGAAERLIEESSKGSIQPKNASSGIELDSAKVNSAEYIQSQINHLTSHKISNHYLLSSGSTHILLNVRDKLAYVEDHLIGRTGKQIEFKLTPAMLKGNPKSITAAEADQVMAGKLYNQYAFDQFLWLCYLTLSEQQLLRGLKDSSSIKVSENFHLKHYLHTPVHVILATALQSSAMTVKQLIAKTQVNSGEAMAFVNACHAVGSLELNAESGKKGWKLFG